ncbi:MAG: alpha-ketoacid dehydrogenase subunit beta [Kiritimatiellia bacterium]|jgi:pyruvate/2-oxoglutarate/acetoin dehydrogenase E1 component
MKQATTVQILRETLADEMRRDERVFLLGEDIGVYGGSFGVTRGLVDEFGPERVRDTPIAEPAILGMAIGAAAGGSVPVAEIMFMDFITLGVDQLVNQAAKLQYLHGMACPLVVRTPSGGGRGYGATHSQCLERLFFGAPGIQIVAPATGADFAGLLKTAIRNPNPVLFVEHKRLYPLRWELPDTPIEPIPFGTARVAREGTDLTILAWSWMAHLATRVADRLAEDEIAAEVIDLRTLAPLDREALLASARKTGRVLVVEEGPVTGGIAAELAAIVGEHAHGALSAPVRRIASPDCPVPAAKTLEAAVIPDEESIYQAALELATL